MWKWSNQIRWSISPLEVSFWWIEDDTPTNCCTHLKLLSAIVHVDFYEIQLYGLFAFNGQETGGRDGGMTCRIGLPEAGFEPGSPTVRTMTSTREPGALSMELNTSSFSMKFKRNLSWSNITKPFLTEYTYSVFHSSFYCNSDVILSTAAELTGPERKASSGSH